MPRKRITSADHQNNNRHRCLTGNRLARADALCVLSEMESVYSRGSRRSAARREAKISLALLGQRIELASIARHQSDTGGRVTLARRSFVRLAAGARALVHYHSERRDGR